KAVKNNDARRVSKIWSLTAAVAGCLSLGAAGEARAEEAEAPATSVPAAIAPEPTTSVAATAKPPAPAVAPAPPAPPYSLPWQLRPVTVGNVLRSDTAVAFYDGPMGNGYGNSVATMLLGSYKVTPNFAPLVRFGFVQNSAPLAAPNGTSFVNPV